MFETCAEPIYRFSIIDYIVMSAYLTMLVSIGFIMKKLCSDVKDYFIGGNRVSWQLAGASCFMGSFSAWTFTGAAGFAYKYGILIMLLFLFNSISFIFTGFFIAAKCRQTRKVTYLQIIYDRFGRVTEQFFAYVQVPLMLFSGAIWLVGLAMFVSVSFGLPMDLTIIISGAIVIIYSTLGGSWGVLASAFLQGLILVVLTTVIAILVLIKTGGIGPFVAKLEPAKLNFFGSEHSKFWALAYFAQIFFMFCSITGAPRFLSVRDGKSAAKSCFFAAGLFLVGIFVWFIPPLAANIYFPNIEKILPSLSHPQDAAYILMGLEVLPHGLAGLLIMIMFAATISSMDVAMNQNAAILCLNIYKPLLRPKASEKEMFLVAHVFNVFLGIVVVILSLVFAHQKQMSLFELMLFLSGSICLPIVIPLLFVYWIKKAPRWSALASSITGCIFSILTKNHGVLSVPHKWATNILNDTGFFKLDPASEWPFTFQISGIILLSGGIFLVSTLFWKRLPKDQKDSIEQFYTIMNSPIDLEKENVQPQDHRQFAVTGRLAVIVGLGIILLALPSATTTQRLATIITGALIGIGGIFMYKLGKKDAIKLSQTKNKIQPTYVSQK
ncbi:MAG: hypothetical protein ABFD79_17080 [Phycisphaerales bacterium]